MWVITLKIFCTYTLTYNPGAGPLYIFRCISQHLCWVCETFPWKHQVPPETWFFSLLLGERWLLFLLKLGVVISYPLASRCVCVSLSHAHTLTIIKEHSPEVLTLYGVLSVGLRHRGTIQACPDKRWGAKSSIPDLKSLLTSQPPLLNPFKTQKSKHCRLHLAYHLAFKDLPGQLEWIYRLTYRIATGQRTGKKQSWARDY